MIIMAMVIMPWSCMWGHGQALEADHDNGH